MLVAPLASVALVLTIATMPLADPSRPAAALSNQQKNAAIQPLVRSATECIARTVAADPRFQTRPENVGDAIADSMPPCLGPVRAMIDAYDRHFGQGTGEAFFMGPYLDVLPAAVSKWVSEQAR